MPDDAAKLGRSLDAAAVRHAVQRMARQPAAPWLHAEIARRMAERLSLIRLKPHLIVDWWSQLGGGAALLEAAYPGVPRVAVEPDAVFAARPPAGAAAPWWSPRRWRGAAPQPLHEDDELPRGAQLVWSNMMLHAVADPPSLIARWQQLLEVDGFVMFSCLGPGSVPELRAMYRARGWPAPTQDFVDMHDLGDMLVQAGFADPVMDQEVLTLTWTDARSALAELRGIGGNACAQRFAGLRTPRWQQRLHEALSATGSGRPSLQFEIVYGHAFKARPRARAGEPTVVSLDAMRAMVRSPRAAP
jgi:malonyl-CoA O-methyltransferase